MDPLSGISSVATGGCAIPWCGVLAGRSIGARSRTSVPARASRKMRAPVATLEIRDAGASPVATTSIRLSSKRLVMSRGIVTTPHGPGQRTLRRPQPSHRRDHDGGLLLVDEVPCPGYAVHDECRQRGREDRDFLLTDSALVDRGPEEQTDGTPHLGEMRPQPLGLAPFGHGQKRLERRVQIVRRARRVTVDYAIGHPR